MSDPFYGSDGPGDLNLEELFALPSAGRDMETADPESSILNHEKGILKSLGDRAVEAFGIEEETYVIVSSVPFDEKPEFLIEFDRLHNDRVPMQGILRKLVHRATSGPHRPANKGSISIYAMPNDGEKDRTRITLEKDRKGKLQITDIATGQTRIDGLDIKFVLDGLKCEPTALGNVNRSIGARPEFIATSSKEQDPLRDSIREVFTSRKANSSIVVYEFPPDPELPKVVVHRSAFRDSAENMEIKISRPRNDPSHVRTLHFKQVHLGESLLPVFICHEETIGEGMTWAKTKLPSRPGLRIMTPGQQQFILDSISEGGRDWRSSEYGQV